jgi:hypothetical protein
VNEPLFKLHAVGSMAETVNVCKELTVIVKLWGVPTQPFAVGVTVIVAVTGLALPFVAVKAGILPVPLAAKPMLVVLFVQA